MKRKLELTIELIKLKDKFILVSDEVPKIGDLCIRRKNNEIWRFTEGDSTVHHKMPNTEIKGKKILSENPDFSLLSEEDCKTIGFIDIEKLADERLSKNNGNFAGARQLYIDGFSEAQSLNDKRFSENDMIKLVSAAFTVKSHNETLIEDFDKWFNKRIQSIQQTSWDVEVNELNQITKIL